MFYKPNSTAQVVKLLKSGKYLPNTRNTIEILETVIAIIKNSGFAGL